MNSTLCIDIGNTSATIGVYENGAVLYTHRAPSLEPHISLSEIPKRAVIASVKPPVNDLWETFLKKNGVEEILWVDHKPELGISVTYPKPGKIGADCLRTLVPPQNYTARLRLFAILARLDFRHNHA